jgi:hypothetical protein
MRFKEILDVSFQSFASRDLQGIDAWQSWTPTYSFATATSLTVTGRFHIIGRQCFFVVKSTGTSLATTAGTSYIALPIPAVGGGTGDMQNTTTNVAVGTGVIDVTNSRFYPPTQAASGNNFTFAGWYEV